MDCWGGGLVLLGVVPLLAGIIWVDIRYSMTNFILLDQGISGTAAITASKQMMKGNYGKLFLLDLSFLPWYLPSIIGIAPELVLIILGTMDDYNTVMLLITVWFPIWMLVQSVMLLFLKPYQGACHARFYVSFGTNVITPNSHYSNGDIYEGEWQGGKRNGQGKMTYSDGRVYEGDWKKGS